MVIRNISGENYSIPTSWDDIKLKTYLDVAKLKDVKEEEFKELIIISHYTGIPLQTLKRMKLSDLNEIINDMSFLAKEIPEMAIEQFTISGETFHVMQSFLLEEAQDYFAVEAILQEANHDPMKALPKLLAVVCKKQGESLDDISIEKRQTFFLENLSVQQAESLKVFFYQCASLFKINSLLYSNSDQIIQKKVQEVETTLKRLDGTGWYGTWLKKTLQRFLRYYEHVWKTSYSGTQSTSKNSNIKRTLKRYLKRKRAAKSTEDKQLR